MNESNIGKVSVSILETEYVTHDVKRFVLERPDGFSFIPGQAVNISINKPEWKNEFRPYNFTSLPDAPFLEFMIKIYPNRNGVTKVMGGMNKGEELILHDVFGSILFKGNGVFIAAGSGITPFLSILRSLQKLKRVQDNILIYSNKTIDDVIMGEELHEMLGNRFVNFFTRQNVIGFLDRKLDRDFLIEVVPDFKEHFYICGPETFVSEVTMLLKSLGASASAIVFEQ